MADFRQPENPQLNAHGELIHLLSTEGLPRETHRAAMGVHKALGITILALALARILWRLFHRPPPRPAGTPRWEIWTSRGVHFLFYALLILLPLPS